ncbi:hypothetical protein IAQ61_001432 [Plenodomus lingam]|uniref:Predicted protein n=1 Tax=Leptosphaeria maculans (strain JN3 / isolate v23.1.3 / race Av1-4-5-6-7-8) TaxID=985895 RepID=E4ZY12_LEPMJ|nr:predicted protein [Plenodomus lingam JN3]KAH9879613.1 hypothetical protein IAQ61_001432 [Plenodomus lingam]CBX96257.1 predicted protein [Plenodomus lingam JN3]
MSHPHHRSDPHSQPVEIEEMVEKYSTPSAGSRPKLASRQSVKPLATTVTGRGSAIMSRASSPMHSSSTFDLNNTYESQQNHTHSGYFDRAQLFGRTPPPEFVPRPRRPPTAASPRHEAFPEQSSGKQPKPTALARIQANPSSSLYALEAATTKLDAEPVATPPFRILSRHSSYFAPQDRSSDEVNTPARDSQTNSGRDSAKSIRSSRSSLLSSAYHDEWIEAGTPEATTSGTVSPLETDDTSVSAVERQMNKSEPRNLSSAMAAWRDHMFNGGSPAASGDGDARQLSWTRRIFGGRTIPSKSTVTTQTTLRNDKSTNSGHGARTTSTEIVRNTADLMESGRSSKDTDNKEALSTDDLEEDESSDSDAELTFYDSSSGSETPPLFHLETSPPYEPADHSEPDISPSMDGETEEALNGAGLIQGNSKVTSNSRDCGHSTTLSRSPEPTRTSITPLEKTVLTMMNPITIFSQAPEAPHEASDPVPTAPTPPLKIMMPITIHSQTPTTPMNFPGSPPTQSKSPQPRNPPSHQQHLTSSQEFAIIYGCVSFAAVRVALMNVGRDLHGCDLLHDIVVGLIAGLVIVVMSCFVGVDALLKVGEEGLLAFGAAVEEVYGMMVDWNGRYEC